MLRELLTDFSWFFDISKGSRLLAVLMSLSLPAMYFAPHAEKAGDIDWYLVASIGIEDQVCDAADVLGSAYRRRSSR